jgi:hypothetical protein
MKEAFLYYVWGYQKFSDAPLLTVDEKSVEVLKPGNLDRGRDLIFLIRNFTLTACCGMVL